MRKRRHASRYAQSVIAATHENAARYSYRVGQRVQVELPNGYKDSGTIVRLFKNMSAGVREDAKSRYYVRSLGMLTPIA